MEHKNTPSFPIKVIDEDLGIVEHIITVFGIVDLGGDKSHLGSFTKTIAERGDKVLVLDSHNTMSGLSVIGKPLVLREVNRAGLPIEIQEKYPEATGGVWAKTQFLMDTPEGVGIFKRLKADALREWSYGYDALDYDYETIKNADNAETTVRNLRTIKLYEYSAVPWGLNQATTTIGTKGADEEKPWQAFLVDGEYCVFKLDADGNRTGSSLGCHSSEDEANGQIAALYASEKDEEVPEKEEIPKEDAGLDMEEDWLLEDLKAQWTRAYINDLLDSAFLYIESGGEKDEDGKTTPRDLRHLPYKNAEGSVDLPHLRNALSRLGQSGTGRGWLSEDLRARLRAKAEQILENADKAAPEATSLEIIGEKLDALLEAFKPLMELMKEKEEAPAPEDLAAETPKEAGPVEPPTSDMLRAIEIELLELELMEV